MPRKQTAPRQRRVRGTGSIFRDKRRGGWKGKLPSGRTPEGKLKYDWFRGPTPKAVADLMDQRLPPAPTITLADWSKRWLDSLDVREQSKGNYEDYFRLRVLPSLGSRPVAAITSFDIEEAWRNWTVGETGVGSTTARLTLGALSTCFRAAVRARIITENPVRDARKPKAVKVEHDIFSVEEMDRIIGACLSDRKLYPLAVCAAVGVRIGEAIGHRPQDYNRATHELSITRTFVVRTGGFGPPKSDNSLRTIPVPKYLAPALALPPDTTRYRTFLSRWEKLLKRLEIRYRGIHSLRHTVASHMNASGVPIANAAEHMGHTVAEYTATYCHKIKKYDVRPVLEGLYGGGKVAPKRGKPQKTKPKRK